MLELLATYSITEILVFIIMLAVAFKAVVSYGAWLVDWLKKRFGGKSQNEIQEELQEEATEEARNNILHGRLVLGEQKMREHEEKIDKLTKMVELLLTSDRDNIKAYIVEKHHYFCYTKKWIDDYSMDCLEKKYETYKQENGNSYVGDLIKELRALPKKPLGK